MKKSILILAVLLPLFSISQSGNKVVTIDDKVYNGDIISTTGHFIHFDTGVNPKLRSNNLEIAKIKEIHGFLLITTKQAIQKRNNSILFYSENGTLDTTKINSLSYQPYNQKLSGYNLTAGDYLQKAGTRYLTGIGVAIAGGLVAVAGSATNNSDAFALAGGVMVLVGGVISLTGHFQLIKAGKALNREAITLSPSKEGIGLAINF